jgi:uncharacterized membrane-anchored protein
VTVRHRTLAISFALSFLLGVVPGANAQQQTDFDALNWQEGPTVGKLGAIAQIAIPEGYRFLGRGDAGKFMELTQNPSDGSELGLLFNDDSAWFVVFEFSPDGYVKDDERELDAEAILSRFRQGTEEANKIRRERGWPTMEVLGWQQQPFYDPQTNNLTWAIRGSSEGSSTINHSTRLLGRRGVMNVNLVLSLEDVGNAVPAFDSVMTEFSFNSGQRYSEFTGGDKVAEYGLTGLIVGGTGVALVKTGLLQKFWKLIVLGFIAVAGAARRFLGSFGRREEVADQSSNV